MNAKESERIYVSFIIYIDGLSHLHNKGQYGHVHKAHGSEGEDLSHLLAKKKNLPLIICIFVKYNAENQLCLSQDTQEGPTAPIVTCCSSSSRSS